MKPVDRKHLLGGYATGTLTPEERKLLFDAALEDQELFEALAQEQALQEALDRPEVRRELIGVLETPSRSKSWFGAWLRWPYPVAAMAVAAVVVIGIAIVRSSGSPARQVSQSSSQVAEVRPMAAQVRAPEQPLTPPSAPLSKPKRAKAPEKAPEVAVLSDTPAPIVIPEPKAVFSSPSAPKAQTTMVLSDAGERGQARDLFYRAAPAETAAPAGVANGVVGGVVGGYPAAVTQRYRAALGTSVSPGAILGVRFSLGPTAQLTVESNVDAVLYIFRRGTSGGWLPVNPGGISLKQHVPATAPAIAAEPNAPAPRALLVLSRTPLALAGPDITGEVERLRTSAIGSPLVTQVDDGSTFILSARPATMLLTPLATP